MSKYIRDSQAAKKFSSWIILDPWKKHIAMVHAHRGESLTTVNIFHTDGRTPVQFGRAKGGGYYKLDSALSGLIVDGIRIRDESEKDAHTDQVLALYKKDRDESEIPCTMQLANGGDSVFYVAGLRILEKLGYTVIQAF